MLHLRKLNIVFITMYRPPSCETDKFKSILQIISNEIEKLGTPSPTVIICGDCNFPIIDWNKMVPFGGSSAARVQAEAFLEFNDEHFLQQYVQEPTRVKNILDLFLTNNPDVITEISVCDTLMSDHKVIIVGTNISLDYESKIYTPSLSGFAALNFHHSSINWDDIESDLMNLNWSTIFEGKNTEEMVIELNQKVLKICEDNIPLKKKFNKRKCNIPRDRRLLMKKRFKLNKKLGSSTVQEQKNRILRMLNDIELQIKCSHESEA